MKLTRRLRSNLGRYRRHSLPPCLGPPRNQDIQGLSRPPHMDLLLPLAHCIYLCSAGLRGWALHLELPDICKQVHVEEDASSVRLHRFVSDLSGLGMMQRDLADQRFFQLHQPGRYVARRQALGCTALQGPSSYGYF